MDVPPFYEVFVSYFEETTHPTLADFISKHKKMLIAHHNEGENMERVWTTRYTNAHGYFFKESQPELDCENLNWNEIASELVFSCSVDSIIGSRSTASVTTHSTTRALIDEEFLQGFKHTYNNMDSTHKWKLSTGKIIEDVLFSFGLTCRYEHLAHYFIIDLGDKELRGMFTDQEVKEIRKYKHHTLPKINEQLLDYLNSYIGLSTIESIERHCRERHFDFNNDFDRDWAQQSIQKVIRLFQSNYIPLSDHSKADLFNRVWEFIDTVFDDVDINIRTDDATEFLIKCIKGELGSIRVEAEENAKVGITVQKRLKDQLCHLVQNHPHKHQHLVTVGFIIQDLELRTVIMDNPSTYIYRVQKTAPLSFPVTLDEFGHHLGTLLGLTSQMKQLACSTLAILKTPQSVVSTKFENYTK